MKTITWDWSRNRSKTLLSRRRSLTKKTRRRRMLRISFSQSNWSRAKEMFSRTSLSSQISKVEEPSVTLKSTKMVWDTLQPRDSTSRFHSQMSNTHFSNLVLRTSSLLLSISLCTPQSLPETKKLAIFSSLKSPEMSLMTSTWEVEEEDSKTLTNWS